MKSIVNENYRYDPEIEKISKYNLMLHYSTSDIVIGSRVSQKFMNTLTRYKLKSGLYLSYLHWGVDRINGLRIETPLYLIVDSYIKNDFHVYGVRFDIIGTNRYLELLHLDESDILKIELGRIYERGEKICKYPKTINYPGISGGIHVHVQEQTKQFSKICDPDKHTIAPAGTKFHYKIEKKLDNGKYKTIVNKIMYKI